VDICFLDFSDTRSVGWYTGRMNNPPWTDGWTDGRMERTGRTKSLLLKFSAAFRILGTK
jgi:hypothetical protein